MKQVLQLDHYRRPERPEPVQELPHADKIRTADEIQWAQEREILHAELDVRNEELQVAWREVERQSRELRQAQEELRQARAETQAALQCHSKFYDCSPVAYFTLSRRGTIRHLNSHGAKMLGGEFGGFQHKRFGLFVEAADRPVFNNFLACVFAGGKDRCTVTIRNPDGHGTPVFAHLEAFHRDSALTCSVVAIDMTERRRAETALERHRAELEVTIAESTAALSAANQELEGFVYAASHDMKAPLARLNNLATLLSRQLGTRLEGDGHMLLELIQQNALRLNTLVDDLLAHAQIRQQPLSVHALDLGALVQTVLRERGDEIRQKGADVWLDLAPNLRVEADSFSLLQILRNLIENALKYSSPSVPPVIEIGARISDGCCRLWVRDNGIGISKVYHERIFEIFRRLHSYSEYPGTGVGLALVKKAIERMDGRVWVESAPGEGATFHLEWPSSAQAGD